MSKFQDALDKIKHIAETLPDGDPDKLEMIDVEGDYSKLMEWALEKRNDSIAHQDACKILQQKYEARANAFGRKAESMKELCGVIMSCASERSFKGVAGTVSFKSTPSRVFVTDESKLPKKFLKTTITVNKTDLKKALSEGLVIEGAELSNGGETIAIRV